MISMEFEIWHIWILAALILFILEIFTPAFLAGCLGIGSLIAGIFAWIGFSIELQFISFSIGTLACFFGARPFFMRFAHGKNGDFKTNVGALIGKTAKVIVAIDNSKGEGRVTIEGDDWRAENINSEILPIGKKVKILQVESTILIVQTLNSKN
jgi:membrane protein implicated in regulation of membrane protease activity